MDNKYEKRGYLLDDFRLFHLKDEQGTLIDYHYHEFPKLILLWSGTGNYTVDGKRYGLQDNDVLLIGSHLVHRPEFENGSMYERTIIYISPQFLQKYSTQECDLEKIFECTNGHVLRLKENIKLFEIVTQLEQELNTKSYGASVMTHVLLLKLLVELGRMAENPEKASMNFIESGDKRVRDIMAYIDQHLSEELSVDKIAETFYLSKYHMMRLFRLETGQSIYEYLTLKRLQNAKDLIEQGMNATESCYNSGFHSYSSFTRAYAKYFGITPTGRKKKSAQREETFE